LDRYVLAGELALDGAIRPVPGALAMAEAAREWGMRGVAVSPGDAGQAALVDGVEVVAIDHVTRLRGLGGGAIEPTPPAEPPPPVHSGLSDLADLRGHPALRPRL